MADNLNLLDALLTKAKQAGADSADALVAGGASLSLGWRLGKLENLDRSEGGDLGLRVFIGKKQAVVSSSDLSERALDELVERAVSMAKAAPEDPYCGIATPDQLATAIPDLPLSDTAEPAAEQLQAWAAEAEDAARAVKGVTNSEGADASWGRSEVALAATNGFSGTYAITRYSLSASVLAGEGTGMERDYDYATTVFLGDLPDAAKIGRTAGEKAVARLNPQKVGSGQFPVLFDPRCSNSLLGHLGGAINGSSIARGTSFLKDSLNKHIFPEHITVIDDPHRAKGMKSKPFDAEGIANQKRKVIDNGVLTTWVLDLAAARQLGLQSTGHASRGTGGPPSPSLTNFHMEPGAVSREQLIKETGTGFYVTEMMGMGVNGVTGDYSRGASGFWIENGELAYPVSELTIAGNLKDMFMNLTPADDLTFKYATNAPTLRIDGMTVAGK